MADIIKIEKIDEVYLKVHCDPSVGYELNDYFSFKVPGASFIPAVRAKSWDGIIRLYSVLTGYIYVGLLPYIESFCKQREYEIEYLSDFSPDEYSLHEAREFVKSLNVPDIIKERDYQIEAFTYAIRARRMLMLSPTASGKSFIIYLITQYYKRKTLIIVPYTSLVSQLYKDFIDYGFDSKSNVHMIYSGADKVSDKQIIVSTWQSIYKMPKSYFDQFDVIIGDEAHLFKAKSLTSIMKKLSSTQYRFGLTGTLDGSQTHKLVLEGLFGAVRKIISTKELMDQGYLAQLTIKCIVLNYPDEVRKLIAKMDYQTELDYIVRCQARNRFIKNLAISLEGNTLLLFQFVEKHGEVLHKMIKEETNRPVYYVSGKTEVEDREYIRQIVEKKEDAIIIASSVFTTGINMKNLHNVIFSSPSKAKIKTLQSIGRSLRTTEHKTEATLYDIADNFTWKSKHNYTILHFMERVKIYLNEEFKYKIYNVKINN